MGDRWEWVRTVGGIVRIITVVVVAIVAVIAAVVSYSHMADVAHKAGEAWRSYLIPISIDGLIVASALTCLTRQRAGLKNSYLAWTAFGSGALISVLANIADARREPWAIFLASSAPIVLAWAFEMLLMQLRAERQVTDGVHSTSAPTETVRQNQTVVTGTMSPTTTGMPGTPRPAAGTIPSTQPASLPTHVQSGSASTVSAPSTVVPAPSPVTATPAPSIQPPWAPTPPTAGLGTTASGNGNGASAQPERRATAAGRTVPEDMQERIFRMLRAGSTHVQIAKDCGVHPRTVVNYSKRLRERQMMAARNGNERMVRR
jgi:hypothetical protein